MDAFVTPDSDGPILHHASSMRRGSSLQDPRQADLAKQIESGFLVQPKCILLLQNMDPHGIYSSNLGVTLENSQDLLTICQAWESDTKEKSWNDQVLT